MPVGAVVGAAVIGGGATYAASKKNSKAINSATAAQQQSDAQQIAFQREARDQNTAALSPFMQRGNVAGDTINALLGIGGTAVVPQGQQGLPTGQPGVLSQFNPGSVNPDSTGTQFGGAMGAPGAFEPAFNRFGGARVMGGALAPNEFWQQQMQNPGQPAPGQAQPQPAQQGQTSQQAAQSAYEIFKESTGYTSRLKEGMGALTANYFGGGVGQSGAAMKAALRYGQDYASDEFGRYLGYLGNQQGVGFAGASALAGVSQGFADRMGDISQNSANTASQAAIARAQNSGALMSGIAGIAGNAFGALSSYGQPQFPPYMAPGGGYGGSVPHYGYG